MISSMVIPAVMNMVTEKNNQTPEDDASPLKDLFGGDQTGGIANLIGGFLKWIKISHQLHRDPPQL